MIDSFNEINGLLSFSESESADLSCRQRSSRGGKRHDERPLSVLSNQNRRNRERWRDDKGVISKLRNVLGGTQHLVRCLEP